MTAPEADANGASEFDLRDLLRRRSQERFDLCEAYVNPKMVRLLRTIGFDRQYTRAERQYLFDASGVRYLDLLAGFGVHALGRNHPVVKKAIREVLELDLPDLVQMDVSALSGLLAEELIQRVSGMERVFFCNSGTEAVEGAIKLARAATRRPRLIYCDHGFHGLTIGSLSLNGDSIFRTGFEPLLADVTRIPFDDLPALERALRGRDVAAFFVEPIQGKGVHVPSAGYLAEAARLCRNHGALFVVDEVQTGIGRTGVFLACEEAGVDPDMVLLAKALSGGFVPVGAVLGKRSVFDRMFDRMDRAVVHGSTFGKNNLAMAAALATLHVLDAEALMPNARSRGESLIRRLDLLRAKYDVLKQVRGRGLMIGLEFGPPASLALRAAWSAIESATKGLFCQAVLIPLFARHRILAQVAGHQMNVIKLLPPLCISAADEEWIVGAFDAVLSECHRLPGASWDLLKTLAGHTLRAGVR